jgi:hypothetical protein
VKRMMTTSKWSIERVKFRERGGIGGSYPVE